MALDFTKPLRTRDGREVRIYTTDAGGYFPVHGAVMGDAGWGADHWTADGRWLGEGGGPDNLDLVQADAPEPEQPAPKPAPKIAEQPPRAPASSYRIARVENGWLIEGASRRWIARDPDEIADVLWAEEGGRPLPGLEGGEMGDQAAALGRVAYACGGEG